MLIYFFSYCVGKKALNAGSCSNTSCSSHKMCKQFSLSAAAVAMNEIMKTQVHLALQNRNMPAPSQPEPTTAIVAAAERSKAEKLQDAMDADLGEWHANESLNRKIKERFSKERGR